MVTVFDLVEGGLCRRRWCAHAGALVAAAFSSIVSAQSGGLTFQVGPANITFVSNAGVEIYSGQGAPVTTAAGTTVATANFIRVEKDPALPYLPTVFEVTASGASFVLTELRSQDETFRRTFGFRRGPSGPTDFFNANLKFVDGPGGPQVVIAEGGSMDVTPIDASLDHAFFNTQAISQTTVGGTILSSRSNSRWDQIIGPGQTVPVGENFTISAANSTQAFIVNFLRMPDLQSGAVVTCTAPDVCGVAGTGFFQALFGSAASRPLFGLPANAASTTVLTTLATGIPVPLFGCPPGAHPPPPRDLLATQVGQDLTLQWESVACAKSYEVRARFSDGSTFDINVGDSTRISRSVESVVAFAVASVGDDGSPGPFSPFEPVIRFPQ